jgi:hypothetical protein
MLQALLLTLLGRDARRRHFQQPLLLLPGHLEASPIRILAGRTGKSFEASVLAKNTLIYSQYGGQCYDFVNIFSKKCQQFELETLTTNKNNYFQMHKNDHDSARLGKL